MKTLEYSDIIAPPGAGRVDRYLSTLDLPLSRSRIQKLIEEGQVTVDGKAVRASRKLKGGEVLRITVPPPTRWEVVPEDLPVEVLYEDEHLVVVSKPRGLVVHPAPGHPSGTLVNALLHRCRDLSGIGGVLRPGIVHRLDKDTSGLMVVAKHDSSHRSLQNQFRGRTVSKVYLAVVLGQLVGEGSVERPVGRHPVHRKKMAVDVPAGRPARTSWRVLQSLAGATTLLEVTIETGRTHQIRVHLASLGHPLVGDSVYGGTKRARGVADPRLRRRLLEEQTQALHAWRLSFRHPTTGEMLDFVANPPRDLDQLISDLGGTPVGDATRRAPP